MIHPECLGETTAEGHKNILKEGTKISLSNWKGLREGSTELRVLSNTTLCFHWWLKEEIMNNLTTFSNDSKWLNGKRSCCFRNILELKIILRIAAVLWKTGCTLIWVSRVCIIKCKNKMGKDGLPAVMQAKEKDLGVKLNVRLQCQFLWNLKKKSHYLQMCYR